MVLFSLATVNCSSLTSLSKYQLLRSGFYQLVPSELHVHNRLSLVTKYMYTFGYQFSLNGLRLHWQPMAKP